jgi:hypothetical protein
VSRNSAPLSYTTKTQQYLLLAVAGSVLLSLVYLMVLGSYARNRVDVFFDFLLVGIMVGVQYYYITRIRDGWQTMTKARRWGTGVAAFTIPPIAAAAGIFLAVFGLVIWIASLFFRSLRFPSIGFGAAGMRLHNSTAWLPNFGSWWDDKRVIKDSDGRPLWVGDDEVKYGPDGMPIWVGGREVKYGTDGKPIWIGDDKVIFGNDGQVPKWIGDREVSH